MLNKTPIICKYNLNVLFMELKKERLQEVFEHLRRFHGIFYQKDLADVIGIKRTSLCLAMNGNEAYLTENLFRRICKAYPGVFDINYLLNGEGTLLLPQDVGIEQKAIEKINEIDPKDLMAGVENLLQIAATQIKDNEELRRELQASIAENKALSQVLNTSIQELNDAVHALLSRPYPEVQQEFIKVAEKSNEITKNKKSDKNQK